MDAESDDSERWEDFFGSTTELAKSLLDTYDTWTNHLDVSQNSCAINNNNTNNLSNNLNNNLNNTEINNSNSRSNFSLNSHKFTLHHGDEVEEYEAEEQLVDFVAQSYICETGSNSNRGSNLTLTAIAGGSNSSSNNSSAANSLSSLSLSSNNSNTSNSNKSRDSPSKHRNNIRILSPNVQRIITHSDAEPVEAIDIDALQQQLEQSTLSPVLSQRFLKTSTPNNGHGHNLHSHKLKLSHIPLSKITGKLTQSGSDLVETFDSSSSEYLDALSFSKTEKQQQHQRSSNFTRKPATPAILSLPGSATGGDDEKTPTNATPFNFDAATHKSRKLTLPKQESLSLIEMDAQQQQQQQPQQQQQDKTPTATKEFIASEPLDSAINYLLVSSIEQKLRLSETEAFTATPPEKNNLNGSTELIEAINKPLISKPLVRSVSAACASTIAGSPLLTYARSKSLAAKANTIGGPVPVKLPTAQQLEDLEEASRISAESLDRLTDIKSKFSPKESRKMSGLMLPEIAKLKHRPLSSSSICSTSSSSSSGSDHLNGKLTTSYLASVESLADQSENELMDPHSGMSVFERACMEICDSERSYVEDLGQVIRGYLLDWKERACLRLDELRILFSNIEEIYDFNSTLLKQLINSGMDPVKIAKCFIDLRERFDVYTTYCTSYPEAISLLTRLLQATHTNSLLTSTQKMLQHTLPLGSYLLKPVQRILKYHLLLDNLRKHCDVKEVFQAHEIMRQVARNIDQVKRKLEQQSRVKELSGILDGWLGPELTVLGELRQEGLLMEHNKPRMVFLFGTMLIITKPKEDNRLQFKSYIHQNNLMLSEHLPGEPTSFYVIPYDEPRHQIKLTAKNRDQKRLWAQHIKGAILEKFDNIPNRARELVYKLGDEEDRTPDKNTWKWSLHSNSTTPVYLERRNQYRRSEMRNRSKMKRKTVANSSSFESFNEAAELTVAKETTNNTNQNGNTQKSLSRTNSIEDNMMPALQKLASNLKIGSGNKAESDTVDTVSKKSLGSCTCSQETIAAEHCKCILRDQSTNVRHTSPKSSPFFGGKALKERSKSVPRISFQMEEEDEDDYVNVERKSLHSSNTNLDARKYKTNKSLEIRQYNAKTIPKRIATLKKQRHSKKETSKFYMDLSEFDVSAQTVLKITESTENLVDQKDGVTENQEVLTQTTSEEEKRQDDDAEIVAALTPVEKARKDAQIILDLLKHNKEFERLCKKPPKKRSSENGVSVPTSPEPMSRELPPRPPSKSPPPLESESELQRAQKTPEDGEEGEPIYESLLRNVHVPYKFSPVLGRSKTPMSSPPQYYKSREKKTPLPRPESDYVTLVYSAEGMLQRVGDDIVPRVVESTQRDSNSSSSSGTSSSSSCSTLKRDSQNTVISVDGCCNGNTSSISSGYHSNQTQQMSTSLSEAIYARPMPKNLMQRLLSSTSTLTNGSSKSSMENVSSSEISLPMRARKSIDNITFSFTRCNKPPERRVSDVSDMCRQSIIHRQGSESVGERMAHVDYADPRTLFNMISSVNTSDASLNTLQRDSVFSLTSSNDSVCDGKRPATTANSVHSSSTHFEYEFNVEASLEQDFRDSAIYSDDNDKRPDSDSPSEYVKRPSSPPPPPPPARNRSTHPQVPPKPTAIPIPIKSPVHQCGKMMNGGEVGSFTENAGVGGTVIVCPPHMSQSASRSWVLQQIENFNK